MNVQKILSIIVLAAILFGSGFYTGLKYSSGTTEGLETDIIELTKRNNTLSTRINDLETAARRDAEASQSLADGLTGLSNGLVTAIGRAQSIEDRSQRINYLAGVIDKGITELIKTVEVVQKGSLGIAGSGSN